jgi:hypothetical protein
MLKNVTSDLIGSEWREGGGKSGEKESAVEVQKMNLDFNGDGKVDTGEQFIG